VYATCLARADTALSIFGAKGDVLLARPPRDVRRREAQRTERGLWTTELDEHLVRFQEKLPKTGARGSMAAARRTFISIAIGMARVLRAAGARYGWLTRLLISWDIFRYVVSGARPTS